jgi:hypothetical protein
MPFGRRHIALLLSFDFCVAPLAVQSQVMNVNIPGIAILFAFPVIIPITLYCIIEKIDKRIIEQLIDLKKISILCTLKRIIYFK